jgi:hypothetical protein
MAPSVTEFLEAWQLGALIIFAAAIVGGVAGSIAGRSGSPVLGVLAFIGGALVTYLVLSYLLYGR